MGIHTSGCFGHALVFESVSTIFFSIRPRGERASLWVRQRPRRRTPLRVIGRLRASPRAPPPPRAALEPSAARAAPSSPLPCARGCGRGASPPRRCCVRRNGSASHVQAAPRLQHQVQRGQDVRRARACRRPAHEQRLTRAAGRARSIKTPGGKLTFQYTGKSAGLPRCGDCGCKLNGVRKARPRGAWRRWVAA